MKTRLLFAAIMIYTVANAQLQGGLEQYYYFHNTSAISLGPIAYLQTKNNWYAEARYNYEDVRTFSFYAGKVFSNARKVRYTLIPMAGGVAGRFNGGSLGLHAAVDAGHFFITSQSQYTVSTQNKINNFYFNWAEAGYHINSKLYAGLAMQHTYLFHETRKNIVDLGLLAACSFGQWTFPIYFFNPVKDARFYAFGIVWEWERK
jgi:hypothetical protein